MSPPLLALLATQDLRSTLSLLSSPNTSIRRTSPNTNSPITSSSLPQYAYVRHKRPNGSTTDNDDDGMSLPSLGNRIDRLFRGRPARYVFVAVAGNESVDGRPGPSTVYKRVDLGDKRGGRNKGRLRQEGEAVICPLTKEFDMASERRRSAYQRTQEGSNKEVINVNKRQERRKHKKKREHGKTRPKSVRNNEQSNEHRDQRSAKAVRSHRKTHLQSSHSALPVDILPRNAAQSNGSSRSSRPEPSLRTAKPHHHHTPVVQTQEQRPMETPPLSSLSPVFVQPQMSAEESASFIFGHKNTKTQPQRSTIRPVAQSGIVL